MILIERYIKSKQANEETQMGAFLINFKTLFSEYKIMLITCKSILENNNWLFYIIEMGYLPAIIIPHFPF